MVFVKGAHNQLCKDGRSLFIIEKSYAVLVGQYRRLLRVVGGFGLHSTSLVLLLLVHWLLHLLSSVRGFPELDYLLLAILLHRALARSAVPL